MKIGTNDLKWLLSTVLTAPPPRGPVRSASARHLRCRTTLPIPANDEKDSDDAGPLKVPDSVHVSINPDNLKDYVRPPIYQKDRIYMHAPPAGVSTSLGILVMVPGK
jgi:hypothetical protein